jgi:hypothetical protein
VFLAFAGYDLDCEDSQVLAELIVSVIKHAASEQAFEAAIRPFTCSVSNPGGRPGR